MGWVQVLTAWLMRLGRAAGQGLVALVQRLGKRLVGGSSSSSSSHNVDTVVDITTTTTTTTNRRELFLQSWQQTVGFWNANVREEPVTTTRVEESTTSHHDNNNNNNNNNNNTVLGLPRWDEHARVFWQQWQEAQEEEYRRQLVLVEQQQQQQQHLLLLHGPSSSCLMTSKEREDYIGNLLITKRFGSRSQLERGYCVDQNVSRMEMGDATSFHGGNNENEELDVVQCAICLVDYRLGEAICWSHNQRCNHHFHRTCIMNWLATQQRNDCPCCRNNYLALSDDGGDDDEEEEEEEEERDRLNEDTTNNDDDEIAGAEHASPTMIEISQARIHDANTWIPFYLTELGTSENSEGSCSHEDDENDTSSTSSSIERECYTRMSNDSADEEHTSSSSYANSIVYDDTDVWSCPSVQDGSTISVIEYEIPIFRNRIRHLATKSHANMDPPTSEVEIGLGLEDLVVDEMMRQLEEQGGCTNKKGTDVDSSSSNSMYTEGSTSSERSAEQGKANVCAICCRPYQVNEELCWSQDPCCAHVFHRACMKDWIADRDYCPFCNPHRDDQAIPV